MPCTATSAGRRSVGCLGRYRIRAPDAEAGRGDGVGSPCRAPRHHPALEQPGSATLSLRCRSHAIGKTTLTARATGAAADEYLLYVPRISLEQALAGAALCIEPPVTHLTFSSGYTMLSLLCVIDLSLSVSACLGVRPQAVGIAGRAYMVRSSRTTTHRQAVSSHVRYLRAIEEAVAEFGAAVRPLLRAKVGQPEASLTAPATRLLQRAATALGLKSTIHPEASYRDLGVRPDLAVDVGGVRAGVVELKAPGRGIPGDRAWRKAREREQWQRLSALPNVIYTDGQRWGLYRFGVREEVAELDGDLYTAGDRLRPVDERLAALLQSFLLWTPDPPRGLAELIRISAGLCHLLRAEVIASLEAERRGRVERLFLAHLADWQEWLFPDLDEAGFADAYAQTVTFGLLLARRAGVGFEGLEIPEIGGRLAKQHLLVGRALSILTTSPGKGRNIEQRSIVLQTMRRVIEVADWSQWPTAGTYHWLYEEFLQAYDPALRRQTGSYYTPTAVTDFITRFVHEVLKSELGVSDGLAARDVVVLDPAMGTGTFLQSVVDRVATHIEEDGGDVAAALRGLVPRLIGFERQIGPFAVAELKLDQALRAYKVEISDEKLRLHVADTLGDPHKATLPARAHLQHYAPLAESLNAANKVKTTENVMVVLGNPPYRALAKQFGRWILARSRTGSSLLDDFRAPGKGRYEAKLHDTSIYFWRWALWKAFESTPSASAGVVAFITTRAYLEGPGFAGMRSYLRRKADLGWVIDVSAEGHRSSAKTRVFPGVQHPVCIGIFARTGRQPESIPARIRYLSLSGTQSEKFARLSEIDVEDPAFRDCARSLEEPLLPAQSDSWTRHPLVDDLLPYGSQGVKANRAWVHHPDPEVLAERWRELVTSGQNERSALLKETASRTIDFAPSDPSIGRVQPPLRTETLTRICVERMGFRSFDRQYLIKDRRVLDRATEDLWITASPNQIFMVTKDRRSLPTGPAAVFSALVPDTDYLHGRGGRVIPLFRDTGGRIPNVTKPLASLLGRRLGVRVCAKDVMPYVAALVAHPDYTKRFAEELEQRGVRVPLTADPALWQEAVELGRQVIWLHTYGERCTGSGRPSGVPKSLRPRVIEPVSSRPEDMPEELRYDPDTKSLRFGTGVLAPVSQRAWLYDVSGMRIIKHWFDYRKRNPAGRKGGSPLDDLTTTCWPNFMTEELRDLVAVLEGCVALEPQQADLLDRIASGPLVTTNELEEAQVLPPPAASSKPLPVAGGLF